MEKLQNEKKRRTVVAGICMGCVVYFAVYFIMLDKLPLWMREMCIRDRKTSEYVFEARKRNIQILLPDVNRSHNQYGIEDNALRFPFVGIKGIGSAVSSLIVEERDKKGEFRDFFDFTARMNGNKTVSYTHLDVYKRQLLYSIWSFC